MSITIAGIQIDVGARTTKLTSAIGELQKFAKATQSSLTSSHRFSKNSETAFLKQERAIRSARIALSVYLASARKLGDRAPQSAMEALTRQFGTLDRAMKSGQLNGLDFARSVDKWKYSLTDAKIKLTDTKTAMKDTAQATKNLRFQELSKAVQIALGPLSGVASRLTAIASLANTSTVIIAGLTAAFIAFGGLLFKAVKEGTAFESQLFRLNAQLEATGHAVGFTTAQVNQMAIELGRATLTSASAARDAASTLIGFGNIVGANFQRALELSQDLAVVMGRDLTSTVRVLGRALQDPEAAMDQLRRAGVRLNLVEKQQIKDLIALGKSYQAQSLILDKVAASVGGAGVGESRGLAGAWDTLGESFHEFLQLSVTTGGSLNALTVMVNDITRLFTDFNEGVDAGSSIVASFDTALRILASSISFVVNNLDILMGLLVGAFLGKILIMMVTGVGTLITSFVGFTAAIGTATGAMTAFNAVTLLNPIILVTAAVVSAVLAYTDWGDALLDLLGFGDDVNDMLERQLRFLRSLSGAPDAAKVLETQALLNEAYAREEELLTDIAGARAALATGSGVPAIRMAAESGIADATEELDILRETIRLTEEALAEAAHIANPDYFNAEDFAETLVKLTSDFLSFVDAQHDFEQQLTFVRDGFRYLAEDGSELAAILETMGMTAEQFRRRLVDLATQINPVTAATKAARNEFALLEMEYNNVIGAVNDNGFDGLGVSIGALEPETLKLIQDLGLMENSINLGADALLELTTQLNALNDALIVNRQLEELTSLIEDMRTPIEQYAAEMRKLGEMEVWAKQNLEARQLLEALEAIRRKTLEINPVFQAVKSIATNAFSSIADVMKDAVKSGEFSFESLRTVALDVIGDILDKVWELAVINPLLNSIFGSGEPTAGGSAIPDALGSIFGSGGGSAPAGFATQSGPPSSALGGSGGGGGPDLIGAAMLAIQFAGLFAHGGSHTVGGSGGTDSQTVVLRATPGEVVSVMTPGQANSGGAGNGGAVVYQTIQLQTGVQQTVRAEVMNMLPQISRATQAGMINAKKRNKLGAFR